MLISWQFFGVDLRQQNADGSASSGMSIGEAQTRDGVCGICPAGCFVRAKLEGGILTKVEPQPDHPLGMLCTIGAHSPEIVNDPDRLKYPMRRIPGGRGLRTGCIRPRSAGEPKHTALRGLPLADPGSAN